MQDPESESGQKAKRANRIVKARGPPDKSGGGMQRTEHDNATAGDKRFKFYRVRAPRSFRDSQHGTREVKRYCHIVLKPSPLSKDREAAGQEEIMQTVAFDIGRHH